MSPNWLGVGMSIVDIGFCGRLLLLMNGWCGCGCGCWGFGGDGWSVVLPMEYDVFVELRVDGVGWSDAILTLSPALNSEEKSMSVLARGPFASPLPWERLLGELV